MKLKRVIALSDEEGKIGEQFRVSEACSIRKVNIRRDDECEMSDSKRERQFQLPKSEEESRERSETADELIDRTDSELRWRGNR